jgi:hypothetical protein
VEANWRISIPSFATRRQQRRVMDSYRAFSCGRCRRYQHVCVSCDRGQVYCGECRHARRRRCVREAGRCYQDSQRGRFLHAERQRRYWLRVAARRALQAPLAAAFSMREKHKVTHQRVSTRATPKAAPLASRSLCGSATKSPPACSYCEQSCGPYLRLGRADKRRRRRLTIRSRDAESEHFQRPRRAAAHTRK